MSLKTVKLLKKKQQLLSENIKNCEKENYCAKLYFTVFFFFFFFLLILDHSMTACKF